MAFGPDRLEAALAALQPGQGSREYCVAYSGGLDSTALLHAMAALARRDGAMRLRAMHVDHALQPDSASWAEGCAASCQALGIPFELIRLEPRASVANVEALARDARYAAFAAQLSPGEGLLTAHHQEDQFETLLIQLFRGAGVAGLAAMPARAPLGAGWHGRPLLDVARAGLMAYARGESLRWIEDPMNAAPHLDRGYLRAGILPAILARWPRAAMTVSRSAAHLGQAQRLLAGLAEIDAEGLIDGSGRLSAVGLQGLSRDRQANLLRWWIQQRGLLPPSSARLATALGQLLNAREDAMPLICWRGAELRRYRGRLYALQPLAEPPGSAIRLDPAAGEAADLGAGLGQFGLVAGGEGGMRNLPGEDWTVRFRCGGEAMRPDPARPRRSLKQLLQEAGIVPWMRDRLPLVYAGTRLAAVGDLWIDADFRAPTGEPALAPVWSGRPQLY